MVAKGKVYNTLGDTIHNRPLPIGCVKVGIDAVIEDDAELPVPDEYDDLISIHDAIGNFVAWPISLIQLDCTVCICYNFTKLANIYLQSLMIHKFKIFRIVHHLKGMK